MPLLGAVQTPTTLSSGERVAVINNESFGAGAISMAIATTPQPQPVVLAIHNASGQAITLLASPDNAAGGATYLPVSVDGFTITIATGNVSLVAVASGIFYAVSSAAAIASGTVWLAR